MSEEILTVEGIKSLTDGEYVTGLVLVSNYSKQTNKKGGSYIDGMLEAQGQLPFKSWSNSEAFSELDSDPSWKGKIAMVTAKVNDWGGFRSLIVEGIREYTGNEYGKSNFLKTVYDADKYMGVLKGLINKNCSDEAIEAFDVIMDIPMLKDRFTLEFAAKAMHDNVKSGLLAHSLKVTKLASMASMYPDLLHRIDKSMLFLGCALHDIGKVMEYTDGVIEGRGTMLSHNTFGAWMLFSKETELVSLLGEKHFYELISVVQQHHGEYGERPRTLLAYVVHQLDLLESMFTMLNTQVQGTPAGEQVRFDDLRLV